MTGRHSKGMAWAIVAKRWHGDAARSAELKGKGAEKVCCERNRYGSAGTGDARDSKGNAAILFERQWHGIDQIGSAQIRDGKALQRRGLNSDGLA